MSVKTADASSVDNLEKQVDGLLKQIDEVIKLHGEEGEGGGPIPRRRLGKRDEDSGESLLEKIAARLEKIEARLEKEDCDDDEMMDGGKKKKKFNFDKNAKTDDKTDDNMAKGAEGDDESITVAGQTILKSEVGGPQFLIFKSMADSLAKSQEEIQKHKDDAEMARLIKRADDEFPHLAGTSVEKAQMLKSLTVLPKEQREAIEKQMTVANKLAKGAFDTLGVGAGHGNEDFAKAASSFKTKVAEIKKRDNCSNTEALSKARHEDPEGFKAYQGQN